MNRMRYLGTHEDEKDENCTGRAKTDFDEAIAQQPDTFSTKEDQGCSSYILRNKTRQLLHEFIHENPLLLFLECLKVAVSPDWEEFF